MSDAPIEIVLLAGGALLVASALASRLTSRFNVPALLLFLGIGMVAGSEGLGIGFADPRSAQGLGVSALVFILFSGGLHTDWREVRPVLGPAVALSTLGVLA